MGGGFYRLGYIAMISTPEIVVVYVGLEREFSKWTEKETVLRNVLRSLLSSFFKKKKKFIRFLLPTSIKLRKLLYSPSNMYVHHSSEITLVYFFFFFSTIIPLSYVL